MTRPTSFRRRVAARIALVVSALVVLGSILGYAALHRFLYRRLDSTVLRLAQIEVAATADSPDEHVHFHDTVFLSGGPGHETILERFAEVWTLEGAPVIRSSNLGVRNLPLPDNVRLDVIEQDRPQLFSFTWHGQSYRSILYPLGLLGPLHAPHLLQVAATTAEADALLRRVVAFLAALVILGFGLGGGLGWWLAGYALRPVLEIIGSAEAFQLASPGHSITAHADTVELRRLVTVLNRMLTRIDETFAKQREFLADAGHALRTPLTILRGDIEVALLRARTTPEYRATLAQTLADLRDLSSLAEDLITLARLDGDRLPIGESMVSLDALIGDRAHRFGGVASRANIRLMVGPAEVTRVAGDRELLGHAIDNLIDNAIKYCPAGSTITLTLTGDADWAVMSVVDDGPGLSAEEIGRVRQRFQRGADSRGIAGSGLGLSIVDGIAVAHGGRLSVERGTPGGLVARVWVRRTVA